MDSIVKNVCSSPLPMVPVQAVDPARKKAVFDGTEAGIRENERAQHSGDHLRKVIKLNSLFEHFATDAGRGTSVIVCSTVLLTSGLP